jgi:hypothetical protein
MVVAGKLVRYLGQKLCGQKLVEFCPHLARQVPIAGMMSAYTFYAVQPLRHAGRPSILSHPQSVGESQRDCLQSVVESRSCRTYGRPGLPIKRDADSPHSLGAFSECPP